MTRDDVIRLAREADLWLTSDERIAAVVRFAQLVAAAEREACAKVCDERAAKAPMGSDEQCEAEDCAAAIRARSKT
jgi:hypothetical protein